MKTYRLFRASALTLFCLTARPGYASQDVSEPAPLPVTVSATDTKIRYVGRFDTSQPDGPRCQWSASSVIVRFRGTALNARLADSGKDDRWQVEVDGKPAQKLTLSQGKHTYAAASDLPAGEHTIRLLRATEAFCGITQVLGFELSAGGELLAVPVPRHRIEVIGDSISCGYGNEGKSQNEHFTPATENAYFTYGAIAARGLDADYQCIAWSGRKMWPDNTVPEIYELSLPTEPASKWTPDTKAWTPDTKAWTPDVILINLATNDFASGNPDEEKWTGAYRAFITRLRGWYPKAEIYCATGPMMGDWDQKRLSLTTLRGYLTRMIAAINTDGDAHVHLIEFDQQKIENGLGSDWHPNIRTHEIMSDRLTETLKRDMKW